MASNLTWLQAFYLASDPATARCVRRAAWQQWIYTGPPLWFLWIPPGGSPEVLRVTLGGIVSGAIGDVVATDMLATDWTDEPWTDPTTGVGPYPPGFTGSTPVAPGAPAVVLSSSFNFGTASNGPGPGAQNPPPPTFGGSGGVAPGGGEPPPNIVPQNPPSSSPVITVQITPPTPGDLFAADSRYDSGPNCFSPTGDTSTPITLASLGCEVVIAGGPSGAYPLSVVLGSGSPHLGTFGKGDIDSRPFSSVSFLPGSTITITATYTVSGTPYTGSASYTFPGWCGWTLPTAITIGTVVPVPGTMGVGSEGYIVNVAVDGSTASADAHTITVTMNGLTATGSMYPGGSGFSHTFEFATSQGSGTLNASYAYPSAYGGPFAASAPFSS
jgi:hypothetical protein